MLIQQLIILITRQSPF